VTPAALMAIIEAALTGITGLIRVGESLFASGQMSAEQLQALRDRVRKAADESDSAWDQRIREIRDRA
jgi:CRISPR/Cas system-associated endoribonuclease Cas2